MDSIMNVIMPEAMIKSIEKISKSKNCSSNTIIKLSIARFLFDQTLQTPEIHTNENDHKSSGKQLNVTSKEIPIDKIVSVQYTLDDGRIIHIVRLNKTP